MERLGPSDYEAVLGFVHQLHAVDRADAFPRRAMAGIGRLIPCEILTYNEIEPRKHRALTLQDPVGAIGPTLVAAFEHYADQHPLILYYGRTRDSRPRKISDFLTLRQFRRLDLYHELFGRLSIHHQMAVTIPSSPDLVIGIALNRSTHDFSERDRAVLDVIRPHLIQAYRNAAERTTLRERAEKAEHSLWSASATNLAALTGREHEILVLVARGQTNPQIADRLRLSSRTVQKHLEHVYEKLGVRTRTEAAMMLQARSQNQEATLALTR